VGLRGKGVRFIHPAFERELLLGHLRNRQAQVAHLREGHPSCRRGFLVRQRQVGLERRREGLKALTTIQRYFITELFLV
jgi:capsid protein